MATTDLLDRAMRNNADWCDIVTRAHGLSATFGDGLWWSPSRTPDFYPDAVTLRAGLPARTVLAAVDASDGCSVKDSFADLDLGAHGFRLLIEGTWIGRPPGRPDRPPPRASLSWSAARTARDLADLGAAWGGGGPHPFRPALLDDPRVTLLTGRLGRRVVAGAALNDSGPVTGISNVFAVDSETSGAAAEDAEPELWAELETALAEHLPGRPLVGWSSAGHDRGSLSRGFSKLGPLRVWLR